MTEVDVLLKMILYLASQIVELNEMLDDEIRENQLLTRERDAYKEELKYGNY